MNIYEFRDKYPTQYNDMSDQEVAEAMWKKKHPEGDVSYMEYASQFLAVPEQATRYGYIPPEDEFDEEQAARDRAARREALFMGAVDPMLALDDPVDTVQAIRDATNTVKRLGLKTAGAFGHGMAALTKNVRDVWDMTVRPERNRKIGYEPILLKGMEVDEDLLNTIHRASPDEDTLVLLRDTVTTSLDQAYEQYKGFADKTGQMVSENTEQTPGIVDFSENVIAGAVGGGLPGIAEFIMGVPWAMLTAAAEEHGADPKEAITRIVGAGAERYMIGKAFHYMGDLTRLLKTSMMGTMFGVQTYAHTGDFDQAAESVGIGFAYGMMGGAGHKGLYELWGPDHNKQIRLAAEKAERAEIGKQWKKEGTLEEKIVDPAAKKGENEAEISPPRVERSVVEETVKEYFDYVNSGKPFDAMDAEHLNVFRYDTVDSVALGIEKQVKDNLEKAKALGSAKEGQAETAKKVGDYDPAKDIDPTDPSQAQAAAEVNALTLTGKNLSYIQKFHKGTTDLATRLTYWRAYAEGLSAHVDTLAQKAIENPTEANLLEFYDRYRYMSDIVAHLKGATSNIARATASGNIRVNGEMINVRNVTPEMMENAEVRYQMGESVELLGGLNRIKKVAHDVRKARTLEKRLRNSEQISDHRLTKAFIEYRTANLLSSKNTFLVNVQSNVMRSMFDLLEKSVEWGIGKATDSPGRMKSKELAARYSSFISGMYKYYLAMPVKGVAKGAKFAVTQPKQAVQNIKDFNFEQWAENLSLDPVIRSAEVSKEAAISRENLQHTWLDPFIRLGSHPASSVAEAMYAGVDTLGKSVRSVGFGTMNMMDAIHKSVIIEMESNALMLREAMDMGMSSAKAAEYAQVQTGRLMKYLRGEKQTLSEVDRNTIVNLAESTRVAARELVWQAELGDAGRAATSLLNRAPILKIVVPFFRTPMNILKFTARRTPGAYQLYELASNNEMRLLSKDPAVRNKAASELATGMALYGLSAALVLGGNVTGTHDPKQRARLLDAGIPEYAFKWRGKWHQYNRHDPFGMFLGITADVHTLGTRLDTDAGDELRHFLILSLSNNLASKSYLQSVQDFALALTDGGARSGGLAQSIFKSLLPLSGLASSVTDTVDQTARERIADPSLGSFAEYMETVKSTYAPQLQAQALNWMGTPDDKYDFWYRLLTGAKAYEDKTDTSPAQKWFDDLHINTKRSPREILGVELTEPEQYKIKQTLGELQFEKHMSSLAEPYLASEKRMLGLERQLATDMINLFYTTAQTLVSADPQFMDAAVKQMEHEMSNLVKETDVKKSMSRKERVETTREGLGKPYAERPKPKPMEIPGLTTK